MFPYIAVTSVIGMLALASPQRRTSAFLWLSAFLVLLIFVGLRHKVGMDWNNYLYMIQKANMGDLTNAMKVAEPAYAFILWVSGQLGLGVYGANLVTSMVFCLGLFRYARSTSSPWMALTVAMPILVIVVAMSANRQAAAIGVILWAMADWDRCSFLRRSAYVLAAAMFHASAVLFLIFTVADARFRLVTKVILIGVLLVASFMILQYAGRAERYDAAYVSGQSQLTYSSGAVLHVLLNGGPALVMFAGRRWRETLLPNVLLRQMALMAIALLPMALVFSAAAGRVSLYLFPVSMSVFANLGRLPSLQRLAPVIRLLSVAFLCSLLVYWLTSANSNRAHIPYGNLLTTPPELWRLCC